MEDLTGYSGIEPKDYALAFSPRDNVAFDRSRTHTGGCGTNSGILRNHYILAGRQRRKLGCRFLLRIEEVARTRYRILNGDHRRVSAGEGPWTDRGQRFLAPGPPLGITIEVHGLAVDNAISVRQCLSSFDCGFQGIRSSKNQVPRHGRFSTNKLKAQALPTHLHRDGPGRRRSSGASRCSLCLSPSKTSY